MNGAKNMKNACFTSLLTSTWVSFDHNENHVDTHNDTHNDAHNDTHIDTHIHTHFNTPFPFPFTVPFFSFPNTYFASISAAAASPLMIAFI